MAIELTDDGTLDTVLRCSDCGEEMRYNYTPSDDCPVCGADERSGCYCALDTPTWEAARAKQYDAWVAEIITEAESEHECAQLIALGFDKGARGCSQCQALSINGTPTHEAGCPNQTFECRGCNARVSRKGAYCEECR